MASRGARRRRSVRRRDRGPTAPAAARLLAAVDAELSAELAAIEYAGCAVVCLAYRRDQFGRPPKGFGFVVPQIENRRILAASFASEKFPGRAPQTKC